MRYTDLIEAACADLAEVPRQGQGWETGKVENQIQTTRSCLFQPRPRFASL